MIYMFKVVLLALMAWDEAKQYARARVAMHRIAAVAPRERLAISRTDSRNRDARSLHAA